MHKPNIIKLPNGKYTLAGTLPVSVTDYAVNYIGQPFAKTRVYDTPEQAQPDLNIALEYYKLRKDITKGVK